MLKVEKLSKNFSGLVVVDQVSFELEKGDIHALIGSNGAGKTTLVNMISGRTKATAGSIIFKGKPISHLPAYKRVRMGIAYTFQITNIYKNLNLFENIAIAIQHCCSCSEQQIKDSADKVLQQIGLAQYKKAIAGTLSYGHQRLLEIAMGLATSPELLILDEPTQGLTDGEIQQFLSLIKEINKEVTILLIEHNMHVVMSITKTISVLHAGRLLAKGTPIEIQNNPSVQAAYLGSQC